MLACLLFLTFVMQMKLFKKSITLFISFLILFQCVGLAVNVHSCKMKGKSKVEFGTKEELSCCKKKTKKDCCKNERHILQVINTDTPPASVSVPQVLPTIQIFNFVSSYLIQYFISEILTSYTIQHPPALNEVCISIRFRSILI